MSNDSGKTQTQYIDAADFAARLRAAGFSGDALVTMLAVTMGESNLDLYARNPTQDYAGQGEKSKGLIQINTFAHSVSDEEAYDPDFAARYAYQLYQGRGGDFQDWGAYTAGTYRQYLAQAQAAVDASAGLSPSAWGPSIVPDQIGQSLSAWLGYSNLGDGQYTLMGYQLNNTGMIAVVAGAAIAVMVILGRR